jgi:hypothetical protein
MSESTYLGICIRKADEAEFWKVLIERNEVNKPYEPDDTDEHGNPMFEVPEANYGWWESLKAAAARGCVFHGWHGPGGEYDGHHFVSIGLKYYDIVYGISGPYILVDNKGDPIPSEIQRAKDFLAAEKLAEERMGESHG